MNKKGQARAAKGRERQASRRVANPASTVAMQHDKAYFQRTVSIVWAWILGAMAVLGFGFAAIEFADDYAPNLEISIVGGFPLAHTLSSQIAVAFMWTGSRLIVAYRKAGHTVAGD